MKQEPFTDLIDQATQMLMDRSLEEAILIYKVALLDPELKSAIIIAYRNIYEKEG